MYLMGHFARSTSSERARLAPRIVARDDDGPARRGHAQRAVGAQEHGQVATRQDGAVAAGLQLDGVQRAAGVERLQVQVRLPKRPGRAQQVDDRQAARDLQREHVAGLGVRQRLGERGPRQPFLDAVERHPGSAHDGRARLAQLDVDLRRHRQRPARPRARRGRSRRTDGSLGRRSRDRRTGATCRTRTRGEQTEDDDHPGVHGGEGTAVARAMQHRNPASYVRNVPGCAPFVKAHYGCESLKQPAQ